MSVVFVPARCAAPASREPKREPKRKPKREPKREPSYERSRKRSCGCNRESRGAR